MKHWKALWWFLTVISHMLYVKQSLLLFLLFANALFFIPSACFIATIVFFLNKSVFYFVELIVPSFFFVLLDSESSVIVMKCSMFWIKIPLKSFSHFIPIILMLYSSCASHFSKVLTYCTMFEVRWICCKCVRPKESKHTHTQIRPNDGKFIKWVETFCNCSQFIM